MLSQLLRFSLWEDWNSPPNMIEQLLTERREVGCLLASGAECLHLPLPSPARHLSPIPTIHLSFILLKPSPPYKTNTPPPSVWLLFCSLLDFTLLNHNMSQIVSYLKKKVMVRLKIVLQTITTSVWKSNKVFSCSLTGNIRVRNKVLKNVKRVSTEIKWVWPGPMKPWASSRLWLPLISKIC